MEESNLDKEDKKDKETKEDIDSHEESRESRESKEEFLKKDVFPGDKDKKVEKKYLWKLLTFLFALLFVISIFTSGFGIGGGIIGMVTGGTAADKALEFINENLLQYGSVELKEVNEESGVYVLDMEINGQEYVSYVTKDGKLLFTSGIDMTQILEINNQQAQEQGQAQVEVPKLDKPEVELFVMSHCPYGTQAEKGIIPAVKTLGDKIDFNLRFVYYAMHGEKEVKEQLNQYCIQKEQKEKLLGYLECFLKEGEGDKCLGEVGIDKDKLGKCVISKDKEFSVSENLEDESSWLSGVYPLFDVDKELNVEYGVGGSPTLVINGVMVSSNRDSASFLKTICETFKTEPSECDEDLSTATPSPGFGFTTTASDSAGGAAQCG